MTLLELAARCEQATEPDRGLDYDILEQCDRKRWRYCSQDYLELCTRLKEKGLWDARKSGAYAHAFAGTPNYTASLDAAMTLVPEGYDFAVFRTNGGLTTHAWCGNREDVFGETTVLALCAAALRARASLDIDVGEGRG